MDKLTSFISQNLASIIIAVIILAALFFAIKKLVKKRGCGCGCGCCEYRERCVGSDQSCKKESKQSRGGDET